MISHSKWRDIFQYVVSHYEKRHLVTNIQSETMTADTSAEDMSEFVISTVPAGGVAPLG